MSSTAGPVLCGVVRGRISDREAARVRRIARRHGAVLVRHVGPSCVCGLGCRAGCDYGAWLELPAGDGWRVPELLRAVGRVEVRLPGAPLTRVGVYLGGA